MADTDCNGADSSRSSKRPALPPPRARRSAAAAGAATLSSCPSSRPLLVPLPPCPSPSAAAAPPHPQWPPWGCGSPGPRSCTTAGRPCRQSWWRSCCSCRGRGAGGGAAHEHGQHADHAFRGCSSPPVLQGAGHAVRAGQGWRGPRLLAALPGVPTCRAHCLAALHSPLRPCPRPAWLLASPHPRCTASCRWNALSVCR